jgi:hypothetical protein
MTYKPSDLVLKAIAKGKKAIEELREKISKRKYTPLLPLEFLKEQLSYDPENGNFTWLISKSGVVNHDEPAGHTEKSGYHRIKINGKAYSAHRLAWFYMTGKDPKQQTVDHKDGNKLNNVFSNLRLADEIQQQCNRTKKGYRLKHGKYEVAIKVAGIYLYLGRYKTEEEASAIHKYAENILFGEFAFCNSR